MGVSPYVLWSTMLVISANGTVGVHQESTQQFANKASCESAIELLVKGRPGKEVERLDGYVRTTVEIKGVLMANRLQCIPSDILLEHK